VNDLAFQDEHDWLIKMLDASPTGMVCGATITWTTFSGGKNSVGNNGFYTPREARKSALRAARRCGWTYPRWWQFWRWDDTRPSLDFT
jgi:hypothetical protein